MIGYLFNKILYQPLFNFLVLLCKYIPGHDFGIAIIILTILIKLVLYPLGRKAIESQKALSEIQPQIKEIQEKYKNDKEKQVKETLEVYKKAKINPISGFLPLLIQLPILLALYRVFWNGLKTNQLNLLYSFISFSGQINPFFLKIFDLSKSNIILAVTAGILQFLQTKMTIPKIKKNINKTPDISIMMQKQMVYFLPFFTILILFKLPSAVGLYWATSTLFTIAQQYFVFKRPR